MILFPPLRQEASDSTAQQQAEKKEKESETF
jgi:hypothetical protein